MRSTISRFNIWLGAGVMVAAAITGLLDFSNADTPAGPKAPASQASAPATEKAGVTLQSLTVKSPDYDRVMDQFVDSRYRGDRATPLMMATLHVHSPDQMIATDLSFDAVADDTGKNLLAGMTVLPRPQIMAMQPTNISRDRHEGFVEVMFPSGPASGAKEITFAGTAKLQIGKGTTSVKKKIALTVGTSFDAAGTTFKIGFVTHYSDYTVSFSVPKYPLAMESMALTDGAGVLYAGAPFRIDNLGRETRLLYSLKQLPAEAQVEVTWYDKTQEVKVPFVLKAGVGY